jgi:hypothetical protein
MCLFVSFVSYEEEDTCMSCEEEDTCSCLFVSFVSYEEDLDRAHV